MKKLFFLLLLLIVLPVTFLSAQHVTNSTTSTASRVDLYDVSPFIIPTDLKNVIKNYRKEWTRLTNLEFSGLHWNQAIVLYINKNPQTYLENHKANKKLADNTADKVTFATYPVGTVLLKENYLVENGVPKAPVSVTLMIKQEKNYDPGVGDWQFVQFDPTGKPLITGNSKTGTAGTACVQCHQGMADRDYVFSNFASSMLVK